MVPRGVDSRDKANRFAEKIVNDELFNGESDKIKAAINTDRAAQQQAPAAQQQPTPPAPQQAPRQEQPAAPTAPSAGAQPAAPNPPAQPQQQPQQPNLIQQIQGLFSREVSDANRNGGQHVDDGAHVNDESKNKANPNMKREHEAGRNSGGR